MPADDGGETSSGNIDRKVIDVVDDVNANPTNFYRSGLGQLLSPDAIVDIAPNRHDRSNLAKVIKHLWLAHIACMDDQLRALESYDGFGTQQPVRIRNDANDVGLVRTLGSLG
jgi:hypothetical protein